MPIIYVINIFILLLHLNQHTTEAQSPVNEQIRQLWTNYLLLRKDNPLVYFNVELVYNEMPTIMARAYNGNKTMIPHLIRQITYLTRYRLQARAYRELIREMVKSKHNNNDEAIMLASYMKQFEWKVDLDIGGDSNNVKELRITKGDLNSAIIRLPDIVRVVYFAKKFLIVPKVKSDVALQIDVNEPTACMDEIELGYEKWFADERGDNDDFTFRFWNSRSGKVMNAGKDGVEPDADDEATFNDQQYWKLIGQDSTQWFRIQHKKTSMYLKMNEDSSCQVGCFKELSKEDGEYYLWKFQESK